MDAAKYSVQVKFAVLIVLQKILLVIVKVQESCEIVLSLTTSDAMIQFQKNLHCITIDFDEGTKYLTIFLL